MFFILQKEKNHIDNLEVFVMKEILDNQKFLHQYTFMKISDFSKEEIKENIKFKNAIPIGTIDFVQSFLSSFHGINHMSPIEIPEVLRHEKYLKRKYSIVEKYHLPKSGYYFTKYASQLKQFTHTGMIENLKFESYGKTVYLKEGLYQVSEVIDILAEYRCFILQDEIKGIQFYDGDCTILPNEKDIELLKEMVIRYTLDKTRPQAYTFDVALIKDRGLALIECHPHTSVGLYGLSGNFLPYCYKFGLDWYIKYNTQLNKYKV